MPMRGTAIQLPCGAPAVRAECFGTIGQEDAERWMQQFAPGKPYHGLPILAVTTRIEHIDPRARSTFAQSRRALGQPAPWTAVVVTSPVIRVTANFVMRITGNKKYRSFETEQEALRWLDERVRKEAR